MNDRIRELAEQATIIEVISGRGFETTQYIDRFDKEKFAELIVRECIQLAGPEDSYTDDWFKAKSDTVKKIKARFGVEE